MTGSDTRQRIFDAASQLFYEKGFDKTTVAEIISLSETNKGSFYHHFEDKQHLAYNIGFVLLNSIEAGVRSLFPDAEVIERLFLQNGVFWRVFFAEQNIRGFISEIFGISYISVKADVFDAILDLSPASLSNRDLLMIGGVEVALTTRLTAYVGRIADRLRSDELFRFYMRTWLGIYQVPEEIIDSHVDKALELLAGLEVTSRGFEVTIRQA